MTANVRIAARIAIITLAAFVAVAAHTGMNLDHMYVWFLPGR